MEVRRETDIKFDSPAFKTACVVCEKEMTLWFNGGELDVKECCGHRYELEHTRIDFVVSKKS